jgi:hypothetical protein
MHVITVCLQLIRLVAVKHKNVILYTYARYRVFKEEVSIFLVSDSIGNCEIKSSYERVSKWLTRESWLNLQT